MRRNLVALGTYCPRGAFVAGVEIPVHVAGSCPRIAGNDGHWGYKRDDFSRFDFQPVFMSKAANAPGLQLADLTARPIALSQLRPGQPNRAFDIIRPKLGGLKCFP